MRKLILICLLILPSYAMAQDVAANKAVKPKVEDKKAPDAFPVPEARKDKVTLILQAIELSAWRMKEIERQYKEQQELQQKKLSELEIEKMSALRGAGIEEKDFPLYNLDGATMMFIKKKVDAPAKTP